MNALIDEDEIDIALIELVSDIGEFGPTPRQATQMLRERIAILADAIDDFFGDAELITNQTLQ